MGAEDGVEARQDIIVAVVGISDIAVLRIADRWREYLTVFLGLYCHATAVSFVTWSTACAQSTHQLTMVASSSFASLWASASQLG